jgi:hypothetical protein
MGQFGRADPGQFSRVPKSRLKAQVEFAVEWDRNLGAQGFGNAFARLAHVTAPILV